MLCMLMLCASASENEYDHKIMEEMHSMAQGQMADFYKIYNDGKYKNLIQIFSPIIEESYNLLGDLAYMGYDPETVAELKKQKAREKISQIDQNLHGRNFDDVMGEVNDLKNQYGDGAVSDLMFAISIYQNVKHPSEQLESEINFWIEKRKEHSRSFSEKQDDLYYEAAKAMMEKYGKRALPVAREMSSKYREEHRIGQ